MGQRCKTCDHPERFEIDKALVVGTSSIAAVAREFGVSESNLWRHKTNCVGRTLAAAEQAAEVNRGRDLRAELLKLSRRAERLADLAEQKNNLNAAVSAVRELGRLIAIEAHTFPQATRGKISIEQIQELISTYNRGISQDPPDDAIIVEALPAPDPIGKS